MSVGNSPKGSTSFKEQGCRVPEGYQKYMQSHSVIQKIIKTGTNTELQSLKGPLFTS